MSLINDLLKNKLSTESAVDDSAIGAAPEKRDDTAAPAATEAPAAVDPVAETPVEAPEGAAVDAPSQTQEPAEVTPPAVEPEADPATPATEPVEPTEPAVSATEPTVDPVEPADPATAPVEPAVDPAVTADPVVGEDPLAGTEADPVVDPATGAEGTATTDEPGEPTVPVEELPNPEEETPLTPEALEAEVEGDELEIDSDTDDDEDLEAKADEVAEYTEAAQSLEEIAADLEGTLADGGLSPEASVVAQGAVNDVLSDIDEEPMGLPSMEAYTTFVGRQQNTKLTIESIGEKAKELGGKALQALKDLIASIVAGLKAALAKQSRAAQVVKNREALARSMAGKKGPFSFSVSGGALSANAVPQLEKLTIANVLKLSKGKLGLLAASVLWANEFIAHPDQISGMSKYLPEATVEEFFNPTQTSAMEFVLEDAGEFNRLLTLTVDAHEKATKTSTEMEGKLKSVLAAVDRADSSAFSQMKWELLTVTRIIKASTRYADFLADLAIGISKAAPAAE